MGNTVPLSGEVWMPWKECSVVDERLRFVAQLLDGEAMSEVCRAFAISRKTGYKIFERHKEHGLEALTDRHATPTLVALAISTMIAMSLGWTQCSSAGLP
jgi:transposase